MSHPNLRIAILAAEFLETTIRYSVSKNDFQKWTPVFANTLEEIEKKIQSQQLDYLVLAQIARSIKWHIHHGTDTRSIARRIIESLPNTIEFETILMLIDSKIYLTTSIDYEAQEIEHTKHVEILAHKLQKNYPDSNDLYFFMEIIFLKKHFGIFRKPPTFD